MRLFYLFIILLGGPIDYLYRNQVLAVTINLIYSRTHE